MLKKSRKRIKKPLKVRDRENVGSSFTRDFARNIALLQNRFEGCSDITYRFLTISKRKACLVYNLGMTDRKSLQDNILKACFRYQHEDREDFWQSLKAEVLSIGVLEEIQEVDSCIDMVLKGKAVLLIDGYDNVLAMDIEKREKRSVESPTAEIGMRGAKDSFTEVLETNISLIRRRIPSSNLKIENLTLGTYSKTKVNVCYVEDIAHPELVKEVVRRLKLINIDELLNEAYIEELIEDEPYSIFPTILATERPDKSGASLMEGRVIVMQDNSSFALILPAVFMQFFQSVDDYSNHSYFATFIRLVRVVAFIFAVYLPSLYVAVTTYHQEMLPTPFLMSLLNQREGIPFPAVIEAVMMGLAFEILREAGLRLPRSIGQAVSIVGALIIGEAAVTAGLVSAAMVIVTAVTAIAVFTFPTLGLNEPVLFMRLTMVIASGLLGLWGVLIITLLFLGHMTSLRSFAVPYLSPAGPLRLADLDDYFVKAPLWLMKKRPKYLAWKNKIRQRNNQYTGEAKL